MIVNLEGKWTVDISDGITRPVTLPGTLDENRIGDIDIDRSHPALKEDGNPAPVDLRPWATRLTRHHTFEGEAKFTRHISYLPEHEERVFFEVERARCLRLLVDGTEISPVTPGTLSTPYVFEVTTALTKTNGEAEFTLLSDNSYPGLPHDAIVYSSTATDETQTNWNGALGYIRLRTEAQTFLQTVSIYPHEDTADIVALINSDTVYTGTLTVSSDAFASPASTTVTTASGIQKVRIENVPLIDDAKKWDEFEGNLYSVTAQLSGQKAVKTTRFGIRDFGSDDQGRLTLNGRPFFLRGEANCAEFPETGYPPTSEREWKTILETYKAYGINLVRFHSHCPPEAAFNVADEMGMMMQPELSHWDPKHAFEGEESFAYYRTEIEQEVHYLSNHPSFVMLTLGNELAAGDLGHKRMSELIDIAHSIDTTRLYANSSNPHYGAQGYDNDSDIYTAQAFHDHDLRATSAQMEGFLNHRYPNAQNNYDDSMSALRKEYSKPVFGFEVGQYEVLPDFDELEQFQGVTDPANYRLIRDRVHNHGLDSEWKKYVEASGELSLISYREEVEAAMRTADFSGLALLGLQDFPGQGTALVGMLNAHLEPKPYDFAAPERFHSFFTDQLPLVLLPRYTYTNAETLTTEVRIANYGKKALSGPLHYELAGSNIHLEGDLPAAFYPEGALTSAGKFALPLTDIEKATRLDLTVSISGIKNTYPIWVYPEQGVKKPAAIHQTEHFDAAAREVLQKGGTVYLTPVSTKESLPSSIQAQFSTDFWSVGTFPLQDGGMGQLIDTEHPIFEDFPTESHTNWQWWPMATQRAIILPENYRSIVTEMDSYAYLRPMTQLLECRCGNGKLLLSSLGLQNLQQYPEAKALQGAIYKYLESADFAPDQQIDADVIASLVK